MSARLNMKPERPATQQALMNYGEEVWSMAEAGRPTLDILRYAHERLQHIRDAFLEERRPSGFRGSK